MKTEVAVSDQKIKSLELEREQQADEVKKSPILSRHHKNIFLL